MGTAWREVRDGAHGLFVWAVATLIGAGLLVLGAYGTSNVAVRGLASAATTAAVATARTGPDDGPYAMVARLRTYGAHSEEVPTISVEPPRSPLQMDKAIRGLVG